MRICGLDEELESSLVSMIRASQANINNAHTRLVPEIIMVLKGQNMIS